MPHIEARWIGLLVISLILLCGLYFDARRKSAAIKRNEANQCARCGQPLHGSTTLIPISGGGSIIGPWRAKACEKCTQRSNLHQIALWGTVIAAFAVTIFILYL